MSLCVQDFFPVCDANCITLTGRQCEHAGVAAGGSLLNDVQARLGTVMIDGLIISCMQTAKYHEFTQYFCKQSKLKPTAEFEIFKSHTHVNYIIYTSISKTVNVSKSKLPILAI